MTNRPMSLGEIKAVRRRISDRTAGVHSPRPGAGTQRAGHRAQQAVGPHGFLGLVDAGRPCQSNAL